MSTVFIILSACMISLFIVRVTRAFATRHQIGAMPTARMIHTNFRPVLGGLGIFAGLVGGVLVANLMGLLPFESWVQNWHIWAGLIIIILTGLFDDIKGVNPWQKFAGQFAAAVVTVAGGSYISGFYGPIGSELNLGWFSPPFSVLWIMLVINAVNLMDGLDGLAAGVSLITCAGFLFISNMTGNVFLAFVAAGLIGALLGFLRFNYHPASIFMGDVGSLMLGYILACFSIEGLRVAGSQKVLFLASLIVLGMPLTDTLISFFRRMGRGDHPFKADKEHIHHRLLKLGVSHLDTVWLLYYSTMVYVLIGVLITYYQETTGIILFVIGFAMSIFWAWRLGYLETRRIITFGVDEERTVASLRPPIHINRIWHRITIFLGDVFATMLALYVTHWFRFKSGMIDTAGIKSFQDYLQDPVFLTITGSWVLLFWLNGLYRMGWDVSRFDKFVRVSRVITGIILLLFVLLNLDLVLNPAAKEPFNRSQVLTLALYWVLMVVAVNAIRLSIINVEKKLGIFEYSDKNTLIVGANRKARNIIRDIGGNPHLIYNILGVVDQKVDKNALFEELPVLGSYDDLPKLIRDLNVEEVLLAIDESKKQELMTVTAVCDRLQIVVKKLPALRSLVGSGVPDLVGHGLVRIFPEPMVLWQWMLKRLIDLVFALSVGLLTMPLWLTLLVYGRFAHDKPALVARAVMGRNGRIFRMYHFFVFRDSTVDADERSRLERILLATHLDKLPQLFNILRADMSVVGPRAESVEWYRNYQNELQLLHRRLTLRPGITGLAQVKYRFDTSQEDARERAKFDIYYVENVSLLLDLRVILRSILLFLRRGKPLRQG